MRRSTIGLSALLAGFLLSAGLTLGSGRPAAAQAPERTPVSATQTAEAAAAHPLVGAVRLSAPEAPVTAWTVVQWGDALGGWHDVEGWRGELDSGQQKVWWVLGKDFGTGPFRWVVLERPGGRVWAISPAFSLPAGAGQWVIVTAAP
jgi:hypothetical protein